MIQITPKIYLVFWSVLMVMCIGLGGVVVWRLNVLINLLRLMVETKK